MTVHPISFSTIEDGDEVPMEISYLTSGVEVPFTKTEYVVDVIPPVEPGPIDFGPVMGLTNDRMDEISARKETLPWVTGWNRVVAGAAGSAVVPVRSPKNSVGRANYKFWTTDEYVPYAVPVLEDIVNTTTQYSPAKNWENIQLRPFLDDSIAAYTQAMLWRITGNVQHLNNCLAIFAAWASTLVSVEGRNPLNPFGVQGLESAKLYCSWAMPNWARAISLLEYGGAVYLQIIAMKNMLHSVIFLPQLDWWGAGNPTMSLCEARMTLAVAREDMDEFIASIDYFNNRIAGTFCMAADSENQRYPSSYWIPAWPYEPSTQKVFTNGINTSDKLAQFWNFSNAANAQWRDGIMFEDARDISHSHMAFSSISNILETALACGVDLYSQHQARIVSALELHAAWCREALKEMRARSQNQDQWDAQRNWTPVGRYGPSGAPDNTGTPWPFQIGNKWWWRGTAWKTGWEPLYAHYTGKGVDLPNTRALLVGWTDGLTYPGLRAEAPPYPSNQIIHELFTHGIAIS